ncbi:MAG: hypothetical protein EOO88_28285 [Pedobacter sp.]|nr:MAG: hypothetical protein EOO88_28285 [Pedobacter sp.]
MFRTQAERDTDFAKKYIIKQIKELPFEADLRGFSVSAPFSPDTGVVYTYDLKVHWPEGESFLLSPALFRSILDNPFKTKTRKYPIEWPYAVDDIVSVNLKLPSNLSIADVPASSVIKLGERNQYSYWTEFKKESNTLLLNTRFQVLDTYYAPQGYEALREYIDRVLLLQQQLCLFNKK